MTTADLDDLVDALSEGMPSSDAERRLCVSLYELLAAGEPAALDEIARRTSLDRDWVRETLGGWSNVFRDEEGRVVAFGGLALTETAHAFEFDGRRLYTWCAFDPLFLAPVLNVTARVASTCPITGRRVTLTVAPSGISDVDPREAAISFLRPCDVTHEAVVERFCHYVRLFASPDAAAAWTAQHAGTFVLTLDDACELARRTFGGLVEAS